MLEKHLLKEESGRMNIQEDMIWVKKEQSSSMFLKAQQHLAVLS